MMFAEEFGDIELSIDVAGKELHKDDWVFLKLAVEIAQHVSLFIRGAQGIKSEGRFIPKIRVEFKSLPYDTGEGTDGEVCFSCPVLFTSTHHAAQFFSFAFWSINRVGQKPEFGVFYGVKTESLDVTHLTEEALNSFIEAVKHEVYLIWLVDFKSRVDAEKTD